MNTAIKLENVKKSLGKREILKGISFNVPFGSIFGYLGPNGAGKTTTIRILLGLYGADEGNIEILGHKLDKDGGSSKIGFMLDTDGLYDNMSARQNLVFYARLYGVYNSENRISNLAGFVGLKDRLDDIVSTFSKGMRQRLALARAMVHSPEILILDEPTSGVDPLGQIEIRNIMLDLVKKEEKTIFLSSHNLDEVQRICSNIALIDRGQIRLEGKLAELKASQGNNNVIIKISGALQEPLISGLKAKKELGFRQVSGENMIFNPGKGIEVADIVGFLAANSVRIEEAKRTDVSLEELYSNILKDAEKI
jgi:ABC-2 type transport system ATP-binding protein